MRITKPMGRLFYGLLAAQETNFGRLHEEIIRVLNAVLGDRHGTRPEWVTSQHQNAMSLVATRELEDPEEALNLLAEFVTQRENVSNSAADGELVQTIIRLINGPLALNRLAGGSLRDLRRSVLLPDEQRQRENFRLACARCGRTLNYGEMLSINIDEARNEYVACANCVMPITAACSHEGCEARIQVNPKVHKEITKGYRQRYCPDHLPSKVGTTPTDGAEIRFQPVDPGPFTTVSYDVETVPTPRGNIIPESWRPRAVSSSTRARVSENFRRAASPQLRERLDRPRVEWSPDGGLDEDQ